MARGKKISTGTIALIAVGGFAGIVILDHYVLKGKLGISGRINQLIGQLKKSVGVGAGPITPSTPPEGGLGPSNVAMNPEAEASLMEAEEMLAAEEPETAAMARRRGYRSRVRMGGFRY